MPVLELVKSDPQTTPNLMERLREALNQETSLNLSNQELSKSQLTTLFKALEGNETITTLNLSLDQLGGIRAFYTEGLASIGYHIYMAFLQ